MGDKAYLDNLYSQISAAIFSGDAFESAENRKELRSKMALWEHGLRECDLSDSIRIASEAPTREELEDLTLKQLSELKTFMYDEALKSGIFEDLMLVAQVLGKQIDSQYTKHKYEDGGFCIYYDQYGNYMTVTDTASQKILCSTHNERLFIRGDWINFFRPCISKARAVRKKQTEDINERARRDLIKTLVV